MTFNSAPYNRFFSAKLKVNIIFYITITNRKIGKIFKFLIPAFIDTVLLCEGLPRCDLWLPPRFVCLRSTSSQWRRGRWWWLRHVRWRQWWSRWWGRQRPAAPRITCRPPVPPVRAPGRPSWSSVLLSPSPLSIPAPFSRSQDTPCRNGSPSYSVNTFPP
jgi:hypothetical protein